MSKEQVPGIDEVFSAYQADDGRLVVDVMNEETGELVPTPVGELPVERALVGIGYAMKTLHRETDQQRTILSEQIAQLKCHHARIEEMAERHARYLKDRAGALLIELDAKGGATRDKQGRPYFKIPNCGKFAVQLIGRSGIESTEYDSMSEEQRAALHIAHSDFFVIHTEVKPDKTAILAALKNGSDIPGFGIREAVPGVVFKIETGTGIRETGTDRETSAPEASEK